MKFTPLSFKVAYAFAAIPSRYVLENKLWEEAAKLDVNRANVPWEKFPWQKAIIHFSRLLGSVHVGNIDAAKNELKNLNKIYDTLINQKDAYKADQVKIQITTAEAWIQFKEGKTVEALKLMNDAAALEDNTEKAPVTPGEVLPARELLGDMLLQLNRPGEALVAYEADLQNHPNRFNGLYGAALAAEKIKDLEKANKYYSQLVSIANSPGSNRPELETAKLYLKNQKH